MADRFEKFTEHARNVLTFAQEEAQRLNHNYIGTEHLLLGLVRQRDTVAGRVLANLGVDVRKVRVSVERIIGPGDHAALGQVGLTPRAKKVIEHAVDEARRLNHHYIGTEHLLLGLVREPEGIAAGILSHLGLDLDQVRAETVNVLSQFPPGSHPEMGSSARPSVHETAEITKKCKVALEGYYGSRLRGLVLYGSAVRGEARPGDDIDFLVLLSPPFDHFAELRRIVDLLYPIQLESDRLISAKPASSDEFEQGKLQLYRKAKREGVRL